MPTQRNNLLQLFPINITLNNIEREFTDDEKKIFSKLSNETLDNVYNSITINDQVLELEELCNLKKFFQTKINEYVSQLIVPSYSSFELYISESWITKTKNKQAHHSHKHFNSILSGVFYITGEKLNIHFSNPYDNDIIKIDKKARYTSCPDSVGVNINHKGTLLIFPSHLSHWVPPYQGEQERLSLSFNTFFKGMINKIRSQKLELS